MSPERTKNNGRTRAQEPIEKRILSDRKYFGLNVEKLKVHAYVDLTHGPQTPEVVKDCMGLEPEALAPYFFASHDSSKFLGVRITAKRHVNDEGVEIPKTGIIEVTMMGNDWDRCPGTRRYSFAYTFDFAEKKKTMTIDRLGAPHNKQEFFVKQLPAVVKMCRELGVTQISCDAFSACFGGLPKQEDWDRMRERMGKRLNYLQRHLPSSVTERLRGYIQSDDPKSIWKIVNEKLVMNKEMLDREYSLCEQREIRGAFIRGKGYDQSLMTVGLDLLSAATEIQMDDFLYCPFKDKHTYHTWPVFTIDPRNPQAMKMLKNYAKDWGMEPRALTLAEKKELLNQMVKDLRTVGLYQSQRKEQGLYTLSSNDLDHSKVEFKGTAQEWDQFVRISPQDAQDMLMRGFELHTYDRYDCPNPLRIDVDLEKEGQEKLKLRTHLSSGMIFMPEIKFLDQGDVLHIKDPFMMYAENYIQARHIKKQWMQNVIDFALQTKRKEIRFEHFAGSFWSREAVEMGLTIPRDAWKGLHALALHELTLEKMSEWRWMTPEIAEKLVQKVQSLSPNHPKDIYKLAEPDVVMIDDKKICLNDWLIRNNFGSTWNYPYDWVLGLNDEDAMQKARAFLQKPAEDLVETE